MSKRKIIANVLGVAAAAAIAWGVHGLMQIGSCGGAGQPECPPESTPYFLAVALGVVATMGSAYAGGRLGFVALFPAVGAGAIWAGFVAPPEQRAGAFVMGGIFVAVSLVPLVLVAIRSMKKRKAARLIAEGGTAIGTVIDIGDTGVTVNKNPRVKLKLRIEPQDGSSTFEGEKTITASRLELPYLGQRFPVWYDKTERTTFVIGTKVDDSAPPEVRRLFALAQERDPGRPGAGVKAANVAADPLDRLAKLNELRLAGALTEEEFEEQKRRILDS